MSGTGLAADPRQFRDALGTFATGVTIVTTRDARGHDVGLTANSFNSVSLTPPMVLWSLAKTSATRPAFVDAEYFAVHILAADQEPLSRRFAARGVDRFEGLELARGHGGVPLIGGCAARFECRTAFRYEGGDHEIFVGEVLTFERFERTPLVFHGGSYAMAVQMPKGAAAPGAGDEDGSFRQESLAHLLAEAADLIERRRRAEPTVDAGSGYAALAAAKAAEADACRGLAESEVRMLRHLLKRLLSAAG